VSVIAIRHSAAICRELTNTPLDGFLARCMHPLLFTIHNIVHNHMFFCVLSISLFLCSRYLVGLWSDVVWFNLCFLLDTTSARCTGDGPLGQKQFTVRTVPNTASSDIAGFLLGALGIKAGNRVPFAAR
jgi:hypothetical protein